MLTRAWRLRVAPLVPARRSPWATLASRPFSTSDEDEPAISDEPHAHETRKEREQRILARQFAALPSMLETFIKATGHLVVPYHFPIPTLDQVAKKSKKSKNIHLAGLVRDINDIPWRDDARGLNLGRILAKFLKNPKHQAEFPHVVEALEPLGYVVGTQTLNDIEWEHQTMPALRVYYKLYGHSVVPIDFVVPEDDPQWPVEAQGLRLGRRVDNIRIYRKKKTPQQLEDLASIEFAFDAYQAMWSEFILPSLEVFARENGHCNIPSDFVVPPMEPWPQKAWGLPLGTVVTAMRSYDTYADQVKRDARRLEAIEFVWNHLEHQWSNCILPSLEVFSREYGHCDIPSDFVVPATEPWPRKAWGLKLRSVVANMRSKGYYAEQVKRDARHLDTIGFVWDHFEFHWSKCILPSLEAYHGEHGHCLVPKSFVVPSKAPYPQEAWGLPLGNSVSSIRQGTYATQVARDADRLNAIKFAWDAKQERWDTLVLPAFAAFFLVFGHCRVPASFIVPSEEPWPKNTLGLKLGRAYQNMKYRGDYAEQRRQDRARLDAIDFPSKSDDEGISVLP